LFSVLAPNLAISEDGLEKKKEQMIAPSAPGIVHRFQEGLHFALLKKAQQRLNNLGILDRAQKRPAEARKAFEEAMKIYEAFAKQDPDQSSPLLSG
jgi:hypothetical protein